MTVMNLSLNGNRIRYTLGAQEARVYDSDGGSYPVEMTVHRARQLAVAKLLNGRPVAKGTSLEYQSSTGRSTYLWDSEGKLSYLYTGDKDGDWSRANIDPSTKFGSVIAGILLRKGRTFAD